jgi:para-aminobenzoate synthetase/4-amino-4-deoxychorismate lyase
VLLWNQDEQVTEFTIGNLVAEIAGQLFTPPLDCGLLPGTLRAELLAQGTIHERIITRAELASATRLWLINSVRGWLPVRLRDPLPV